MRHSKIIKECLGKTKTIEESKWAYSTLEKVKSGELPKEAIIRVKTKSGEEKPRRNPEYFDKRGISNTQKEKPKRELDYISREREILRRDMKREAEYRRRKARREEDEREREQEEQERKQQEIDEQNRRKKAIERAATKEFKELSWLDTIGRDKEKLMKSLQDKWKKRYGY